MGKQRTGRTKKTTPELRPAAARGTVLEPALAPVLPDWLLRHGPWLGLLALTLAVYLPALHNGFIWDDNALADNPLVAAPGGLLKIWLAPSLNTNEVHYWPLVYSTFWAEYRLWGLYPLGYHLDNILLHALCAVLLWRLLRRLEVRGAWLGAALFAVHPVHVESVAWAIERKDVLSGALYLGAALAWLRYEGRRGSGALLLVAGLFAGALLSKSIAVTLPVTLGLLIWWRRGRLERRDGWALAALAGVALALTILDLTLTTQGSEVYKRLAIPARIQMAGGALWLYLGKLAWPARLAMFYPQWRVDPAAPAAWLPLAAALGLAGGLWALRGRLGRGPLVAALFFGLTLSPALGLVWFNFLSMGWVADRFQYLASIGPLVLAAAALARLGGRAAALQKPLGAALLLALGILTWQQTVLFKDTATLFQHNMDIYPQSWAVRYQLGVTRAGERKYAEAAAAFREAVALNPEGFGILYHDLAVAQEQLGQFEEAGRNYATATRLSPENVLTFNDSGIFLGKQGRFEEAIAQFRQGLQAHPQDADLLSNLGGACLRNGRVTEALEPLERARRLRPQVAQYRLNLAWALGALGRQDEAVAEYEEALKLTPEDARSRANLGVILLGQGKVERAIGHLEQARRQGLQDAPLSYYLGEAYRQAGRVNEALGQYEEALRLRPNYPEAAQRKEELRRGK